jgi:hypothetical protein
LNKIFIEEVEFTNEMDGFTQVDPSKFYIVEEPKNNTNSNVAGSNGPLADTNELKIVELTNTDSMDI